MTSIAAAVTAETTKIVPARTAPAPNEIGKPRAVETPADKAMALPTPNILPVVLLASLAAQPLKVFSKNGVIIFEISAAEALNTAA